jgi:hypothetical protein
VNTTDIITRTVHEGIANTRMETQLLLHMVRTLSTFETWSTKTHKPNSTILDQNEGEIQIVLVKM